MVGIGLSPYVKSIGLEISNGVAFGKYRGYMLTMYEGSKRKTVNFAVKLPTPDAALTLQGILNDRDTRRAYVIINYELTCDYIRVNLGNAVGIMQRLAEFIEFMCDRLDELGAADASYCNKCGEHISEGEGETVLVKSVARRMHRTCADELDRELVQKQEQARQEGNLATGAIGALIGAFVGAIPWAVSLYFGWIISLLGVLIGAASMKGYDLLHGRQGKIKIPFIIISTVIAVAAAQFAVPVISLGVKAAGNAEIRQIVDMLGGTVRTFVWMLQNDTDSLRSMLSSLGQGLLFSGLGLFIVVSNIAKKFSRNNTTVTRL